MDKAEAARILTARLAQFRKRSYPDLVEMIDRQETENIGAPSGKPYQLEFQAFWDGRPGGAVRVTASIDDRGWRAFLPMSLDFIMAPDGSLVGE